MKNQMTLTLSKKQLQLRNDIISRDVNEIYVLGSTQSGKTFIISESVIEYCKELHKYDPKKQYNGAIVGWSIDTVKGNIVDVIENFLSSMGYKKKGKRQRRLYIEMVVTRRKIFEIVEC